MEGKVMKSVMLCISLLLALFMTMPLQAQTISQKGVTYRYNGKNKRTPIGGVYIKPITAANGVVSDESNGAFTLALDNLKMGSRIGNVRVTKQGMMVFNQQAVDEWSVRKDPLCLILCNADEFQKQKKNLIAIGESQAKKKYDKKLAELKKQNDAQQLKIDEYYNKLDSLEDEYQNALKHMDEYADVFARIDESEVDTVAQRAIEMFNRGEIEESIHLLEQQNYMEKIKQANRTIEQADAMISTAEQAKSLAEQDKEKYIEGIKTQIAGYKLQNEWDKAKELLKGLAENLNTLDAIWEYAMFCQKQKHFKDAEEYYLKYDKQVQKRNDINDIERSILLFNLRTNLGILYCISLRYMESEMMFKSALDICKRLVKENPNTFPIEILSIPINLANLYSSTQHYAESERMLKSALEIYKCLAKSNPSVFEPYVVKILTNLGVLFYTSQNYAESETMFKSALEILWRIERTNPNTFTPDIACILNNLASMYGCTQRNAESEAMFKSALEIYKCLAESNPSAFEFDLAKTQANLARLYGNMQRYSESEEMFKVALSVYKHLAISNLSTLEIKLAQVQFDLASLYYEIHNYAEGEKMYNDCLISYLKLNDKHPTMFEKDLMTCYYWLGRTLLLLEKSHEAQEPFKQSLHLARQQVKAGIDTQLYWENLSNLSKIAFLEKDYASAYTYNEELLPVLNAMYREDNERWKTDYSGQLVSQSFYANLLGKFKEGELYSLEAIKVDSTLYMVYTNLAAALLLQGKVEEAEKLYIQYKAEFKDGFLDDFAEFERFGVIPEERKKDVERIKAMLKNVGYNCSDNNMQIEKMDDNISKLAK